MKPSFCVLLVLSAGPAGADSAADLARRLSDFQSPPPIAASLRLELHLEHVLPHASAKAEAAVPLEVDEDATGLRERWDPAVLRRADAEAGQRDQAADRMTPLRDALKELDPDRVSHLLDQAGTLAGLTRG